MAQFSRQIHELESQLKSSHCDQALDPSCEGGGAGVRVGVLV